MSESEFLAAASHGSCPGARPGEPRLSRRDGHRQHNSGSRDRGSAVWRRWRWLGRARYRGSTRMASRRKRRPIHAALARHAGILGDPLRIAAALGGRELAALLGATLAARHQRIPVLLDGYVCTAAVAPLTRLATNALDHVVAGHVSAEGGHRALLDALGLKPLLDSTCGSARPRAPPWQRSSCAPRWPATRAWRPSPRPAFRKSFDAPPGCALTSRNLQQS